MLRAYKTPIFAKGQELTHSLARVEKHAEQETPLPYTPYLRWHHPGWRALLQLAQAPTQDYHSYTHALLGGVEDEDKSPSGSPVRLQENTELLSFCGLTGTPQGVSLLGLGGKGCSCCVHSAYVNVVGLLALPEAEAELFVCVISALVWQGRKQRRQRSCTNHPDLPT